MGIDANWARCTSCHVGYGWKSSSFDFKDETKVDCLVCHDTTGLYKKVPTGAGIPDPFVDLHNVASHVGDTSRSTCGSCHFYGGGGDGVKHGDLDSSLVKGTRDLDVHMGTDGEDFSCQECHTTEDHFITGTAMVASPSNTTSIGCVGCHDENPHNESMINQHMSRIACQTCHIPTFAKELPTKTSWNWETAGKNLKSPKDKYGKPTYAKKKGSFTWGMNIVPTYAWYTGEAGAYLIGDKMDPKEVTKISYPLGDKKNPKAKISPFKIHTGKQPYDTKNNYFTTIHLFGKGGFWKTLDWNKSITAGMKITGLPYSGEYAFGKTIMYWPINHMVAPKEQALGCMDCHGDEGRMDWKELGYKGDPMRN